MSTLIICSQCGNTDGRMWDTGIGEPVCSDCAAVDKWQDCESCEASFIGGSGDDCPNCGAVGVSVPWEGEGCEECGVAAYATLTSSLPGWIEIHRFCRGCTAMAVQFVRNDTGARPVIYPDRIEYIADDGDGMHVYMTLRVA